MLDVLDNYFGPNEDIRRVPGRRLMDFGDEVRRFTGSLAPTSLNPAQHPIYLGGWPSANIWDAGNSHWFLPPLERRS
jgi:hypothetical protein